MIIITLPDGSNLEFKKAITGVEIASKISKNLKNNSIAIKIDGTLRDIKTEITKDSKIELILRDQDEGLEILRHTAAHIMAQAVKELFPETQVTIGPSIKDGFYYDFYNDKRHFTPNDFEIIEGRMHEIVERNEELKREVWDRDKATSFFNSIGETFKAEIISEISSDNDITLYRQGVFLDLCKGPHLFSTGELGKAFKLLKVAGAYWRGNSKNPMLQRIYGTAWANKKQLDGYLFRMKEAKARDHNRLGKELDLFHLQEEAVGSIFWHPKGCKIYNIIENYIRNKLEENSYLEVKTPQLVDKSLWVTSGHWDKFRENMFMVEDEDRTFVIKPMNCPCHIQIFNLGIKSYKDLPFRMAEFGLCHRSESSGSLLGLFRPHSFTQDDGHIYCTEDQIVSETKLFCNLLISVYKAFGFDQDKIKIKFSDRPEKRAGTDEIWEKAENALLEATRSTGLKYTLNPGEGAFYGPKLEFVLQDAIGRDWQCGTFQVDFVLPKRFNITYVNKEGDRSTPVILHRAVIGSFERFIGILIEHFAGKFPLWLAPTQIAIATITNEVDSYANEIFSLLRGKNFRVECDFRNEKISYKIRDLSLRKVPVIFIIGEKEKLNSKVTIRRLGSKTQETLHIDEAVKKLLKEAMVP